MKKNKNIFELFLLKFPKITIYIWIQQFYFGRKQIYLWKHFYTIKKPLKNRAEVAKSHSFIGPIVIYLYNSLTSALKINEVHTSRYQGAKMMY